MKYDCPHCGVSLKARRPSVADFDRFNAGFVCPHCGNQVKGAYHTEEMAGVGVIILSVFLVPQIIGPDSSRVAVVATFGFLVTEVAIMIYVVRRLVRNKQRYIKGHAI